MNSLDLHVGGEVIVGLLYEGVCEGKEGPLQIQLLPDRHRRVRWELQTHEPQLPGGRGKES